MAVGLGALVAWGLAELGAGVVEDRWAADLAYVNRADLAVHQVAADPDVGIVLRPGAVAEFPAQCPWCDDPRRVSVNSRGLRGAADERPLRVVAIGGSFTYGAAVSDDATWPARLQERLTARGEWAVWNAGVSSHSTSQKLRRLALAVAEWEPDLVVLQVHNHGPAAWLPDSAPDAGERWRARPALLDENLDLPPSEAPGPAFFWRTRLGRTLLFGRERRVRAARGGSLTPRTIGRVDARARAAWDAAMPTAVPVVAFRPATGGGEAWWPQAGVPWLDLVGRSPVTGPEWTDIHPGRAAYSWVADELYEWLERRGCWAALERGESGGCVEDYSQNPG